MLGFFILGIFLISVFWKYPEGKPPRRRINSLRGRSASYGASKKIVVFGFCLLFLILGVLRLQLTESKVINSQLRAYNDKPSQILRGKTWEGKEKIITLVGVITSEPDIREKSTKLEISAQLINETEMKGKVLITTGRYPEYKYGDKLKIRGYLKTPQEFPGFNYRDYLKKEGIYSVMSFPEVEFVSRNQGNFIYSKILQFKNKLRESIYSSLNPPQSSILGAMILGDKRKMSTDLKEKLNIAGVRHITAVSGLHIAVLTSILMTFFIALGFWRQQAFFFTIIFIILFIVMTGLQPSAIRAGIMGGLFLFAQHLGRLNQASRAIVFAGVVMLGLNPFLLRLDVGFQLSFLAMIGIIYLLPILRNWLKFIPGENVKTILAMTFAAYFFTLPILIYNFGYISIVAPLTNILIVPLLYWIMIFGFLFAIGGMILPFLGWILSLPAWILLTYVTKMVDWFSGLPFASLTLTNIHWVWPLIFYLILGYFTFYLNKKSRFFPV